MFDCLTIGAATRDCFLESAAFQIIKSKEFQTGLGECVALGSKNEVSEITFETGGGATNAAVTFARLGFKTSILASVGQDTNGEEIIKVLKEEGVKTKGIVKKKDALTAYSTLLLWSGGQRSILVYRGASEQIEWRPLKTKWIYLTSLGGNEATLQAINEHVKKNQISLFWNPGGLEIKLGLEKLKSFLANTAILSLNREEAAVLLQLPFENLKDILNEAKKLAPIVLVTDGEAGAYLSHHEKIYQVTTLGTRAKNPTGAGDAFGSGFLAGWIKYGEINKAAQLAILNSDGVIRYTGAKKGILRAWPSQADLSKIKIMTI